MKRKTFLMAAFAVLFGLGVKAQLTDGTVYWLQDVSTGQFLSQGDNWSTRAVAQDVGGIGFEVTKVSDDVYTLKHIMWNTVRGTSVGLGSDLYVDNGSPAEWTLTASGDGYLLKKGDDYLVNNGSENAYKEKPVGTTTDASAATVWKFLTKTEYDAAIQTYKDGKAAVYATNLGYTASTVAALETVLSTDYIGKDYTAYISNPTLGSNWTDWTHGAISQRGEGAGIGSGCAEFWSGCGYAKQTVASLPNGLYKVGFVGTYRPANSGEANNLVSEKASSPAFVYANDAEMEFLHWIDVPAKANGRDGITQANGYGHSFYTYVSDGTLALGVVADGWMGDNCRIWNPFGQFTLTYYSDQVEDDDITALVATIPEVPAAVAGNLNTLKNNLESAKTIAAYNALSAAIAAANDLVAPYAAYKVAAEDAAIAGVAAATISEQNTAVEAATTVAEINDGTTALRTAIDAVEAFNITSFTIKNSTAQTKDNWEGTDFGDQSDGVREYWNKSAADFHQTLPELPAGKYRLTVVALQRTGMTGTIYVDGKRTVIAEVGNPPVNNRAEASAWFAAGHGVNTVYFTLAEKKDVTIGLTADAATGDHWTVWQGFKLETFDESVAASYLKPGYDVALAAAKAYQDVDMFDWDKTALNTAITDNTVDESSATIAAYETAVANLDAATAAAELAVAQYSRYSDMATAVDGNTNVDLTAFVTNADFQANNLTGWTSVDGGNVANNGNFNATYFVERWKYNVALGDGSLAHDAIALPAGVYRIAADAQNIEQYNGGAGGTGLFLCANDEKTEIGAKGNYDVYIKVADKDYLTIKFLQDNCSGNWVSYDNVTLTYIASDYVYTLVDGTMNSDVRMAQTDAQDAFDMDKTAKNYKALMDAIKAAEASKAAYAVAAAAIADARVIESYYNFVTSDAAKDFDEDIKGIETPYYNGNLLDADAAAAGTTLLAAEKAYMNSVAWTGNELNDWSTEGDSDGSDFRIPFYQIFDNGGLPETTTSAQLTGLDNGLYKVFARVRVRAKDGVDAAEATGVTLKVNNGTPVDVTEGAQVGTTQFSLDTFTAEGLVKDGTLAVVFTVAGDNNINWLSFKDVRYTKVRDLTPEEIAVVPTAIALYNGETEVTAPIALDVATPTVTLTPSYTPTTATDGYITWSTSDASVANVVDGLVSAVSSGTATITVTSTLDASVSASATITVTFPESTVATYINSGATRTIYNLGANLIKNGSFEYPNPVYGWTTADGSANTNRPALVSDNFNIVETGAADGGKYLQGKSNSGQNSPNSIYTAWPIENGKKYVFGYMVKADVASAGNGYLATSLSETVAEGTKLTPDPSYGTDWTNVQYEFTNSDNKAYLVFSARWLGDKKSFDNFYLCEVLADPTVEGNVDYALDAIPTANIGTGAFQYSQAAIDAANALVQGTATVAEVEAAYDAVTTLNAPLPGDVYNIINVSEGYNHAGKAVTFKSASNADLTANTTSMGYTELPGSIYPQGVIFNPVGGVKNGYTLSYLRADGNLVYVGTGSSTGLGSNNEQIRPTTDFTKAVTIQVVPTATDGVWNLYNTLAGKNIGANGANDQGFYTVNTYTSMKLQEAVDNEFHLEITAANQYATLIVPFDAAVPTGAKVYSCNKVEGSTLDLVDNGAIIANTPYIVYAESGVDVTLKGRGAAYTDTKYTDGYLTGVYADVSATEGTYILNNKEGVVAFYKVGETAVNVLANRCYLTVPAGDGAPVLRLGGATNIANVEADADAVVYDLTGRRVDAPAKGIYIINGKKVFVK